MPFDMAEHLDWAGITLIERSGADMATVTVHYGSERWLLSQIIAAGGAIRILDDPPCQSVCAIWQNPRLSALAPPLVACAPQLQIVADPRRFDALVGARGQRR